MAEGFVAAGTGEEAKKPAAVYQGMLKRRADEFDNETDPTVRAKPKKRKKLEKVQKKGELERQRLHEELSRPIDRQSKGYELLAKMGYKPGMTLGKEKGDEGLFIYASFLSIDYISRVGSGEKMGERIKEPIAIPTQFISSARFGLGHVEHDKQEGRAGRLEGGLKKRKKEEKMAPFKEEDFDEQLATYLGRKKAQAKKEHDEDSWFD